MMLRLIRSLTLLDNYLMEYTSSLQGQRQMTQLLLRLLLVCLVSPCVLEFRCVQLSLCVRERLPSTSQGIHRAVLTDIQQFQLLLPNAKLRLELLNFVGSREQLPFTVDAQLCNVMLQLLLTSCSVVELAVKSAFCCT